MKRRILSNSGDRPDRSSLPGPKEKDIDLPSEDLSESSPPERGVDRERAEARAAAYFDEEEAKWLPRSATGARTAGELPDRVRIWLERMNAEMPEGDEPSAPIPKEKLHELREKYKALGSTEESTGLKPFEAISRDFRKEHRDAVRKLRNEGIAGLEIDANGWGRARKSERRTTRLLSAFAAMIFVAAGLAIVFSGAVGERAGRVKLKKPLGFSTMLPSEGVEQVLARFFGADSWTDLLADVRHPEVVEPLMEAWYAKHPYEKQDYEIGAIREGMMSTGAINEPEQLWVFFVEVILEPSGLGTPVFIEQSADGFKVDWESTVGYEEIPFEEFAVREESPPDDKAVDFRVTIMPADYHSHSFSDEKAWVCFQIRTRTSDRILYGYVRKGSKLEQSLKPLFYSGETTIPVIASLKYPDARARAFGLVEIVEIAQKNWVKRYDGGETIGPASPVTSGGGTTP